MPQQFTAVNPNLQDNNLTQLSQPAYAGATTIYVLDTVGFVVNDYYVLDSPGTAKAEAIQITGIVSANQLSVTALAQTHSQGSQLQYTPFNQFQVYRSTTGIGGTYTVLSTVNITWDQQAGTQIIDSTGQSTYAYYVVEYNSTTSAQGSQSSPILGSGYDSNSLFQMKVRAKALLKDRYGVFYTDEQLTQWANEKYNKMHSIAVKSEQGYQTETYGPTVVNLNTQEYILPTDFFEEIYLACTTAGGLAPFPAKILSYQRVRNMQYSANNLQIYAPLTTAMGQMYVYAYIRNTGGNTVVGFYPFWQGTFLLDYYPTSPLLVNDTDIPYYPLNNFTYMIVNYMVMRGYEMSGREDLVTRVQFLKKEDEEEDMKLKGYLNFRQTQGPQEVEDWDQGYMDAGNTDKDDSVFY